MSCITFSNMELCFDGEMLTISINSFELRKACPGTGSQSGLIVAVDTPQKVISHDGVLDLNSDKIHQTAIGLFLKDFVIVLDKNVQLIRGTQFSHLVLMPESQNSKDGKFLMKVFKRSPDELFHFYQERQNFISGFDTQVGFSTLLHDDQTNIVTPPKTHLFDINYNFMRENLEVTVLNLDREPNCFQKSDILETSFDGQVCIEGYS